MSNGIVLLVSGTGGVGKNTIITGILANTNYKFISSYTTRQRRDVDLPNQYKYITKKEFEDKIKAGEIFEFDMFNGEYYGTSKKIFFDALEETNVVIKDISVLGRANITEVLGSEVKVISVFLTESKKVLKQRLINRGEKPEKIKNRLKLYRKEQAQIPYYDYCIKNDVYTSTLEKMHKIVDLSFNKDDLYPTKDCTKLSAKKIDKYASQLEKGKKLKPVLITLHDNKVYLIDGVHRYLAALKTGKNVVKKFVNEKPRNTNVNIDEWKKIVKAYTNN